MQSSVQVSHDVSVPLLLSESLSSSSSSTSSLSCSTSSSNNKSGIEDAMFFRKQEEALLSDVSLGVIRTTREEAPESSCSSEFRIHDNGNYVIDMQTSLNSPPGPPHPEQQKSGLFDFLEIDKNYREMRRSSIDPFRNHTPEIVGVYEMFRTLVCIPLALVRVLLFILVVLIGFLASKLAVLGWKDRHRPMPQWRCKIIWVTRICARCLLFCFGYHWIQRIGKPVSRQIAPIVVSNHVSFTDSIFFFYDLCPSIVASESHDKIPVVGTIIRAMQVIYVDRFSPESRKQAVIEIQRKSSCNEFPRVMLFPEGTTTNGRALISFQHGAFVPGNPVQPVVVRYPFVHFDPSWGNISLLWLMFRMLTQFQNFMEVEYLPVIFPVEAERRSPSLYAKKVGHVLATTLNVVQTEHSYGDLTLSLKSSDLGLIPSSAYEVEMAKMERLFRICTGDAISYLQKFSTMYPNSSGRVDMDNFLKEFGLPRTSLSEEVFAFFDLERQESISFSEYLYTSMHILRCPKFHSACDMAFKCCGADNSNHITKQQVKRALEVVFPHIHEEHVNTFFKHLDGNSDGLVDRKDFKECLKNNPVFVLVFCILISKKGFSYYGHVRP